MLTFDLSTQQILPPVIRPFTDADLDTLAHRMSSTDRARDAQPGNKALEKSVSAKSGVQAHGLSSEDVGDLFSKALHIGCVQESNYEK